MRCREVRDENIDPETLRLDDLVYTPLDAEEHFLSFVTPEDRLAGYLRLSLPSDPASAQRLNLPDLQGAALIREVHVFGQALAVGSEQTGAAQHIGLGTALLQHAANVARSKGFHRLAVIAAIGTRRYYASRGFLSGDLYMVQDLDAS